MKLNARSLILLILNIIFIANILWIGYSILIGQAVVVNIVLFLGLVLLLRSIHRTYDRYTPKADYNTINLAITPKFYNRAATAKDVTPEFIKEILGNERVIRVIQNDLMKTGQIGYQETWRIGLITSDQDCFDPRPDPMPLHDRTKKYFADPNYRSKWNEQIPLKRAAVINSTSYFNSQFQNIVVAGGKISPKIRGYPGWSYSINNPMNKGEFDRFKNIQIVADRGVSEKKCLSLPEFLQEEGFPLQAYYIDGDPLSADRGGTIVLDKGNVLVIYPRYFVQRRLIDDAGNLVDIGMDENFNPSPIFEVKMRPSVSKLLFQRVSVNGYVPIVRYRSFPYASDYMLPLLDTPMSANGWADLFVDTRGKAKLFVAREKTEAEWYEMMDKLKTLFFSELAKNDFHLLGLTRDRASLNHYLYQKQNILEEYFIIQNWELA